MTKVRQTTYAWSKRTTVLSNIYKPLIQLNPMDEILSAIVYGSIIFGAFLSTWAGKTKAGETYDLKQFISSLIIAGIAATASVNVESLAEQLVRIGYIGTIVLYVVAGFVLDQGLSKLDKGKTKKPS